ncbi:TIGR01777 family oxidoreductase [Paraherbaspirillum soli]|uniref:TIGR01777 family oxidoreductase n=1 Tax=Paraherbaspirillum soli TaxID=631222 RepID=A0ABW0M8P3_9BURK
MRVLITGGTGLIGRRLCAALLREGHEISVFSRKPESVKDKCGPAVTPIASLAEWGPDDMFDAVINLAGEPIVDARWTEQRKTKLWQSRVVLTEELVRRIEGARVKPATLLSGSAVGYYGDRGDIKLSESAGPSPAFSSELCKAWEQAAQRAAAFNVRVCTLRTGLVLDGTGGFLGRMLLPFRLGLGARIGDGRQWMSWIHIDDYVAIVLQLLENSDARGPFNMNAPEAVTNAEFTSKLAHALHRPAVFVAPGWLMRLLLGSRAYLLLGGQRVLPAKLEAIGYRFSFPTLDDALRDLIR